MGTETEMKLTDEQMEGWKEVKLNNPLMGTETLFC